MKVLKHFEAGSLEWRKQRIGKITMSPAKTLLADGRGKESYICDVVAETLSGNPIEGYYNEDMERGNYLEDPAIKIFCEITGIEIETVGFVLHDDERIGVTPDGLGKTENIGLEVKCPKERQHVRNAFAGGMKDYFHQAMGGNLVCQTDRWYVVSFCPWVKEYPFHIEVVERDDAMIKKLEESAIDAANKVEDWVAEARAKELPGRVDWLSTKARLAWENALAMTDEVKI